MALPPGSSGYPPAAATLFAADHEEALHPAEAEIRRGRDDDVYLYRLPPNPLSTFLAEFLGSLVDLGAAIRDNIFSKSPVVILSGGAALAANHFAIQHYPSLAGSSDLSFEGSVNVAKFVGVAFLLEAAVAPLFARAERNIEHYANGSTKGKIHAKTIHYLNPLALTLIFAYKTGLNAKALHGTLYTAGIFALIKVLDMGYDRALRTYDKSKRPISEDLRMM